MARHIDLDLLSEQINDDCKYAQATNDYKRGCNEVCDWAIKIIKNMPIADVVPRSEVEELKKEYEDKIAELKKEIEDLESTQEITPEAKYLVDTKADKLISLLTEINKTQDQAKQDVAREIFEEIEKFIESDRGKVICESYGSELEKDLCKTFEIYHNMGTDDTKNALSDFLDELKKKYIGE